ncbi:MAG: PDZ domain-containing protein, partial [Promethearchaeia archaeon]
MGRTHADQRDGSHALHDLHCLQGQPSPGIVSGLLSNRRRFPSPTKHSLPDEDTARIQMVGIGILLDTERMDGQLPVIRSVEPAGGAALSQRVTEGDRIETINGVEVRYVETETIARSLMGPRGSDV